ncbi:MAG: hypothetical protein V1831_02445 [Candidatus Woesearchaeota archaeon]
MFKQRIDRYEDLIKEGDIQGAIKRMKNYGYETRRMGSTLADLFGEIQSFDKNMKIAIGSLQEGNTQNALNLLNDLKKKLKNIHYQAQLVAAEEFKLE